jgi:hypothetical protein
MDILTIKKVGDHWYPCIPHEKGADISLDDYTERFLSLWCSIKGVTEVSFIIEENPWVLNERNVIYINEEDLTRYFVTDDYFPIRFTIDNKEFSIGVYLYYCLTKVFNLSFHTGLYQIKLLNYENQN